MLKVAVYLLFRKDKAAQTWLFTLIAQIVFNKMDVDVVDLSITPVMERSSVGNGGGGEKDVDTLSRDIRTLARNSNITITPSPPTQPNVSSFGNRPMNVSSIQCFKQFPPLFMNALV